MDWSIYNLDSPSGDVPCCRVKKDGTFCPSSDYESDCDDCNINLTDVRSNITLFEVAFRCLQTYIFRTNITAHLWSLLEWFRKEWVFSGDRELVDVISILDLYAILLCCSEIAGSIRNKRPIIRIQVFASLFPKRL